MKYSRLAILIAVGAMLIAALPANSYLSQYTPPAAGGTPSKDKWDFSNAASAFPVKWVLNNGTPGTNITGTRTAAKAIQAAFSTWIAAPNLNLPITQDAAGTAVSQTASDGVNVVCFVCQGDFTKDSTTLAVTFTTTANAAGVSNLHGGSTGFVGQIIDADILFNPNVLFTSDLGGSCANAAANNPCEDLQTVATHEIGHFFGLDHSAVVRAVMYPFAPGSVAPTTPAPQVSTLGMDDVAAAAALYPKVSLDVATGSISGTVTWAGSNVAVFGAHVFAESTSTANAYSGTFPIRKTPIGTLTFADGTYVISGLPGDTYNVTAEPLDFPVSNGDIRGYSAAFGQATVQTSFTTRTY